MKRQVKITIEATVDAPDQVPGKEVAEATLQGVMGFLCAQPGIRATEVAVEADGTAATYGHRNAPRVG